MGVTAAIVFASEHFRRLLQQASQECFLAHECGRYGDFQCCLASLTAAWYLLLLRVALLLPYRSLGCGALHGLRTHHANAIGLSVLSAPLQTLEPHTELPRRVLALHLWA
jgi:hypothetical protein